MVKFINAGVYTQNKLQFDTTPELVKPSHKQIHDVHYDCIVKSKSCSDKLRSLADMS